MDVTTADLQQVAQLGVMERNAAVMRLILGPKMVTISQKLIHDLLAADIPAEDLAEQAGCSPSLIKRIGRERNQRQTLTAPQISDLMIYGAAVAEQRGLGVESEPLAVVTEDDADGSDRE